jgi:hypothetical protein
LIKIHYAKFPHPIQGIHQGTMVKSNSNPEEDDEKGAEEHDAETPQCMHP